MSSNNIYLIYTMGKVGTRSIAQKLRELYSPEVVFAIHFLSDKFLKEYLPLIHPLKGKGAEKAFAIRDYIASHPEKRLKIITMVRDPVMRDLSDLFQKWEYHFSDKTENEVKVDEILKLMAEKTHHHPLNWFDNEFKSYFGFDIYEHPFDKERGYSIYHTPKFDLLCMKLEKLDEIYSEAFKEFLDIDFGELPKENVRSQSEKSKLYHQTKVQYKARSEKLKKVYGSTYVKHFYSPGEIKSFISQWSKKNTIHSLMSYLRLISTLKKH